MIRWRCGVGLVLLLGVALPALLPLLDLLRRPDAWSVWSESGRLFSLSRNTLILAGGTILLTLPVGTLLALLLFRTDLPGRRALLILLLIPLFVPLPLLVAGWERLLTAAPLPLTGMAAAMVLHSVASLPWVVLLVGLGCCQVERGIEEDALTAAPPWRVVTAITLRRAAPALVAAALWVGLQTSSEIGITDLYQVRTFAEEVYTQFVRPEGDSGNVELLMARAVAVSFPALLLTGWLVWIVVRRGEKYLPPLHRLTQPLLFPVGRTRTALTTATALVIVILCGVPVAGLVGRAGLEGAPAHWTLKSVAFHLTRAWELNRHQVGEALALALRVGLQTAALALPACWLARDHRGFRTLVVAVAVLAWSLPGPIIGLGLKQTIDIVLRLTDSPVLAQALYYGPSMEPVAWVQTIRLLPFALALLWPVVRSLPRDLFETIRLEGASPAQELRWLVVPLTWSAWWRCVLIVAAISLGEVSATKLVSTPGATPFSQHVFMELHYGVGNHLAAQCLLLLGALAMFGILASLTPRLASQAARGWRSLRS